MSTETIDASLQIPLAVVSQVDVGRLLRELDALDTFLRSAEMRQAGTATQLPKTSKLFDELLTINKLNALQQADRDKIHAFLTEVRTHAPRIHMSFSADPSPLFTKRLVTWLRQNIHPLIMLQVGLQPTIGAGAVVRTTNKYFDLSLRRRFEDSKDILLRTIKSSLKSETQSHQANVASPAFQPDASAPVEAAR